jgi:hypothetical protein
MRIPSPVSRGQIGRGNGAATPEGPKRRKKAERERGLIVMPAKAGIPEGEDAELFTR